MEDRIAVLDLDDGPVREDRCMLAMNTAHSRVPWKSSHMKKPPRSQEIAELLRLCIGQVPVSDLDAVEKRPVVHVVAVVEVDRLFDGPRLDAREPAERLREVPVGAGIVDGPV